LDILLLAIQQLKLLGTVIDQPLWRKAENSEFSKIVIQFVDFFKTSHMTGSLLRRYIEEYQIKGGGLKTFVETRRTSMYETTSSIVTMYKCPI